VLSMLGPYANTQWAVAAKNDGANPVNINAVA
jgi:hypothetical protein